jgi:hypothetical protein
MGFEGGLMKRQRNERVIHSYDTERHHVLCGFPEQTNSTKHRAAVTCMTCRELLGRSPLAARPVSTAAHDE